MQRALEHIPTLLDAVLPLKAAHRRDLPSAVRELSARLTAERGSDTRPYWSSPRLVSAYLRWFLPWNLQRLTRLLRALDLPAPEAARGEEGRRPLLLDLGSGPLTFPLSLWLARPKWRALPLDITCVDAASRPLELGRALFARLVGENSPWRIRTQRASLDAAGIWEHSARGRPFLISFVNVFNEIKAKRGTPPDARPASFLRKAARLLAFGGSILCVEPGTRLGGKIIEGLRAHSPETGLEPLQPCPHKGPCPLPGTRNWCRFTFDVRGAPRRLTELARDAGLPKKDLSLSFLLLRGRNADAAQPSSPPARDGGASAGQGNRETACSPSSPPARDGGAPLPGGGQTTRSLTARVLSAPFDVPGVTRAARYACSARGLLVLVGAENAPSGTLLCAAWPERPRKDARSGAWIVPLSGNDAE
jgi:hypothetical protein